MIIRNSALLLRTLFVIFALTCGWLVVGGGSDAEAAATCTISATGVDFSAIDTLSDSETTANGTLTVKCDDVTGSYVSVCVELSAGSGNSTESTRLMTSTSGDDTLEYNLYQQAYSEIWGTAANSHAYSAELTASSDAVSTPLTVYGEVTSGQTSVPVGSYTSSITVTLYYVDGSSIDCSSHSDASEATTTMAVEGTVEANCNISAGTLNFGTQTSTALQSGVSATSTLDVTCTPGSKYYIAMGEGNDYFDDTRHMVSGSNTVAYELYQNPGHTTAWGSTNGTDTVDGTASTTSINPIVYGYIPSQDDIPAGDYEDTVVVTITYE